jgi:protoheme IX farnesyltransferase
MTAEAPDVPVSSAKFRDYLELTKPRLSLLSVLTTLVGYFATRPEPNFSKVCFVFLGTSLAAGGVATLNQWIESDTDAKMKRTADRPIPSGKIPTGSAFVLGALMCIASIFLLFAKVNLPACLFTLLTIFAYLGWYTPAKRWSIWSTEIGAVAGALPPLIGWAAGEGRISALGWIIFGILYFWQIPHFMAIAWTYRRDYAAVDFPMLPVRDEAGGKVAWWSFINTVLLVACTILPSLYGFTGKAYQIVTIVLGAGFVWYAVRFLKSDGRDIAARRLFFYSIFWLPLQLAMLVIDRLWLTPAP